ncbi:30S ribosomal protein S8 [Deltaproteobacteria bacterium TL4]
MSMSDPIADLCTRIRNAYMRQGSTVIIPHSKLKEGIVEVLQNEGFIEGWELIQDGNFPSLTVRLKYDHTGDSVIRSIKRVSRPGLRVYKSSRDIKPVLNGQGIGIVTTSSGVLSDKQCRRQKVGGELLCQVW